MPAATVTVGVGSTDLVSVGFGHIVEVYPVDGDIWVNLIGGSAAAEGSNCIKVLQDKPVEIKIGAGVTKLTAIRNGGSNVKTVYWIKDTP